MGYGVKTEQVQFKSLQDTITGTLFLPGDTNHDSSPQSIPAVLFCHGAIDYKEHFFEFAGYLARHGYASLAIDMHGHGQSEGNRYHVRMDQWVPDVIAATDFLAQHPSVDAKRIGAVGFSSGGSAVLEAAIEQCPLKALVTLDATVRNVINPIEVAFFKAVSVAGRIKRRLVGRDVKLPLYRAAIKVPAACNPAVNGDFYRDPYFVKGYTAYPLPGALESLVIDTIDRVDQIKIPVCVIHGEEDQVDSPQSAQLLYEKLSGDKALHIIPQSGHIGHLDYQKEKVQCITKAWFDARL